MPNAQFRFFGYGQNIEWFHYIISYADCSTLTTDTSINDGSDAIRKSIRL